MTKYIISLAGWLATAYAIACQPGCAVGADTASDACPDSPWHYQVRTADGTVAAGDVCDGAQVIDADGWIVIIGPSDVDALDREVREVRVAGQGEPVAVARCGLAPSSVWLTDVDGARTLLTVWCADAWRAE
jgi:hypothetical protein